MSKWLRISIFLVIELMAREYLGLTKQLGYYDCHCKILQGQFSNIVHFLRIKQEDKPIENDRVLLH